MSKEKSSARNVNSTGPPTKIVQLAAYRQGKLSVAVGRPSRPPRKRKRNAATRRCPVAYMHAHSLSLILHEQAIARHVPRTFGRNLHTYLCGLLICHVHVTRFFPTPPLPQVPNWAISVLLSMCCQDPSSEPCSWHGKGVVALHEEPSAQFRTKLQLPHWGKDKGNHGNAAS